MMHYSPVVAAFITLVLALFLTLNKQGLLQDVPNERSLHTTPVPRTGGIALMAGISAGWVLMVQSWIWWIVLPALGLFALSLLDDARNLQPKTRLIGHLFAALIVVGFSGVGWLWMLPVLLFVIWMTNLYNFMDGSDGLAGGMALFGFSFYGIAGLMKEDVAFAMMNFTVGAAALGFLYHNFHPAKIFMGDAGSIPLGFLAAAFGVWGWQHGYWTFWFPVLVFSPFTADATFTLFKRIARREKLSQAHRSHYYQRLVQMGWGHRDTAIAEYVLMFAAGASALWGLHLDANSQLGFLLGWAVIYLLLAAIIDRRWNRFEHSTPGQEQSRD
jgi:UDP-N-acetylmuramyl pentapeptide phosphotransferase/UDP-N-acetylglucosamine-1-phosphate transferase